MKQTWFKKNQVFIAGLLMAVLSTGLELLTAGNGEFSWGIVGWGMFISGLTWAGKNLRGQAASVVTIALMTATNFQTMKLEGNIKWIILLFQAAIALIAVFWTSPPKSRGYEHTDVIEKAKVQGEKMTPTNVGSK